MIFAIIYGVIGLVLAIYYMILFVKEGYIEDYEAATNKATSKFSSMLIMTILFIDIVQLWPIMLTLVIVETCVSNH